jgi:nifR3 family TIM-barrel protein
MVPCLKIRQISLSFTLKSMATTLKIGSLVLRNNLILAPMAGITNLPVRIMSREFGAALAFTEMVSVNGLVRDGKKSFQLLQSHADDRPLGVQLFGDDPGMLADGARLAAPYADLIDINMGCPVRKVVGTGSGSALLREPDKVKNIIRQVRAATTLPLTIKIRSGWQADDPNYLEIGRIAEGEGCDAITLHPRSRCQMFDGHAAWEHLRELKRHLSIPVIGSGDLFSSKDVVRMLEETGCDGAMIARGAMGAPWIFAEAEALLKGKDARNISPDERLSTVLQHVRLFLDIAEEQVVVREMRKHLAWYVRGLPAAARFRDQINHVHSLAELEDLATSYFNQRSAA